MRLQELLQKKEKIIQGLHLKKRHTAAKNQHLALLQTTESVKQVQQEEGAVVDHTTTLNVAGVQSSAAASDLISESHASTLLSENTVGSQHTGEALQKLLKENQYLVIERDTMKEICDEKDAEIIQLQTRFFDAEYHWKEMVAAKEREIVRLLKQFQEEEDVSQDLQKKKEILEQDSADTNTKLLLISEEAGFHETTVRRGE
ncbi:hypothetical protein C0Q70_10701 [Pomacea canaliculata]|uniref:Uncharacterized protein n=1 Tax=Pomacea canaliculata TaxID=400727 RepID=A0A2T7P3X3_POMCA|nr:hypothetical protein C0Q70_10701 [Pomacea canaliculata]